MRRRWALTAVVCTMVTLASCGEAASDTPTGGGLVGATAEIHVYDASVQRSGDDTAEIGMRVHNGGPQDDRLLQASCACEATVAIDGALIVAPEEEVVLAPGGTPGLRLTDLTEELPRGGFMTLTLTFEQAGDVTAEAEVRRASG